MNTTEVALVLRKGFSRVNETVLTIGLSRIDGIYKEYKQYLENTPRGQRSHDELVMICGGVGNYRRFIEGNLSIVKEQEQKSIEANIEARDGRIIKKLHDKGVYSIPEFEAEADADNGFTGFFTVGEYAVTIQMIVAGGYNVQRIHNRVLVTVNKIEGAH